MARTEIYVVRGRKKKWELYAEISGASRGAWAFWMYLEKKYLPPYRLVEGYEPISRLSGSDKDRQQEFWDLSIDGRLTYAERLVFFTTFDYKYLPFAHIPVVVAAMRVVHDVMGGHSSYDEQADILEKLFNEEKDVKAVGFVATSVCYYEDIIGNTCNKKELGNLWEDFLEAEDIFRKAKEE